MEIDKIKELYRDIPATELNERERCLVALLSTTSTDFWDLPTGRFRLLQFSVSDFSELEENLRFIIPDIVRHDAEKQLVIEKYTGNNLSKSELSDSLQVLSQDMGEKIQYYIGSFVLNDELPDTYEEELRFFSQNSRFSEFTISQGLNLVDSLLLDKIKDDLLQSPEDQELVRALYKTHGNQAAAAKILYVHRNTLLNKMKKYEHKYGLQLSGSDLVLAFNLL